MIDRNYIEKVRARLNLVEAELARKETASDQGRFQRLMSEHARLKQVEGLAARYLKLLQEEQETRALVESEAAGSDLAAMAAEDLARITAALPGAERELMVALLPPRPEDSRNTIVEIRAGTGGEEASIFAADLYRMYTRFAERRGWKVSLVDASFSSVRGYKEVIFCVEGKDVYRVLRYESGVHRVQRVPVTEASGRIHTSAATVAVLPDAEPIDDIEIKPEELRIDLCRASGPGGQSVNKTDSAVRITHLPSGIVVQSQDERSQHRNRDKAMRVLRARLLDKMQAEDAARTADERRSQIGTGDRSERIRTYNFPQNRITDHRIDLTLYSLDRVIEGELDALVDALYERDIEGRLAKEMQTA